jgi:hypothetical protein
VIEKSGKSAHLPATPRTIRPGDFLIGSLESRATARALAHARVRSTKVGLRVILESYDVLDLDKSTCRRTLSKDGTITEIVCLHGNANDLSDEQLKAFIAKHPLES